MKYLKQKKLQPPVLEAQIKLHTPGNPIRPVIDYVNAPTYKRAKHLFVIFNRHLHLSNHYNVRNSIALAEKEKKGVSMASPIFGTVAEIFLKYIENTNIQQLLDIKNIFYYTFRWYSTRILYKIHKPWHRPRMHKKNTHKSRNKPNTRKNGRIRFLDIPLRTVLYPNLLSQRTTYRWSKCRKAQPPIPTSH